MKTSKQILEERAAIREQMRDIVRNAENEGRPTLSAEENERFNKFDADFEKLSDELRTAERIEKMRAEEAERAAELDVSKHATRTYTLEERKHLEHSAFWKSLVGYNLTDEEQKFAPKRGVPGATRGTSTQITATDTLGGYLVPTGFSNELERAMKYYGGMLDACRILRTTAGERIEWPTVDDTATMGAITSESSPSIAVSDVTFGIKYLDAYMYNSGIIKTSLQLMQDGYFDLEAEVRDLMAERIGRKANYDLTLENGSDAPNGIINAVTLMTTAADDATISRADLIDVQHAVDIAYRQPTRGAYMLSDSTVKAIKKLSLGSGDDRPLWQQSMRENQPDTIEGFRYYINNDMSSIGAGNKSVLFGDFSKYIIRIVQDTIVVRLNELYMASLQIGFIGYMRMDGELVQNKAIAALRHPNT